MNTDDVREDQVLGEVVRLRPYDPGRIHVERLRRRCHAALRSREQRPAPSVPRDSTWWRRAAGPALVTAWCIAYLLEIVRRAAAVYGF